MSKQKKSKMAELGSRCLAAAVKEQLRLKAFRGQYVIIERNGKPCRIAAKQALKNVKSR